MKIILTADVANLGGPGDIVEVRDGYGRNYLLPRGLAIPATRGAEKQVATIRRAQQSRQIRDREHALEVRQVLADLGAVRLPVRAASDTGRLFGSVTTSDVVAAVRAAGGPVLDKRSVELAGHVKHLGRYPVEVRLHPEVRAEFTVEVVPG